MAKDCNAVCAFVNDKLDANCLKVLKEQGVELIAMRCAGFNNVDLPKCKQLGMRIVRVPAYSPYAVAEHAIALLLTLNRKIHKAYNRTKENNFSLDGLLGFDFHGKTVGIIGAGKIGQCFANICKGFGMNIIYYDIRANPDMDEIGGKFTTLDEVFHQSDLISLHCPLTPDTRHIINKTNIAKMKPNVYIVNTGRGALIDTKHAISALKRK
jgi:D-lactate dehydrogenase